MFYISLVKVSSCLQFVIEVDASGIGVDAVLSQRNPTDTHLHPCAFLSKNYHSEGNSKIDNWELLAVKVALEKWRHWLEGTEQPFLLWTNHKNKYFLSAERLNSRQGWWPVFFNRFISHLSYHHKNTKPFSHVYSPEPSYILPQSCVLGALHWEIEEKVRQATECPPNLLFVLSQFRSAVIHWAHSSTSTPSRPWSHIALDFVTSLPV